jgi:hypothetical protein
MAKWLQGLLRALDVPRSTGSFVRRPVRWLDELFMAMSYRRPINGSDHSRAPSTVRGSVVLSGPPGTGVTNVLSALISDALKRGNTVFVLGTPSSFSRWPRSTKTSRVRPGSVYALRTRKCWPRAGRFRRAPTACRQSTRYANYLSQSNLATPSTTSTRAAGSRRITSLGVTVRIFDPPEVRLTGAVGRPGQGRSGGRSGEAHCSRHHKPQPDS